MRQLRLAGVVDKPSHIVAGADDRHSLCGIKDPMPVVLERHVAMHIKGRGMIVCPDCRPLMREPNDGQR